MALGKLSWVEGPKGPSGLLVIFCVFSWELATRAFFVTPLQHSRLPVLHYLPEFAQTPVH